MKDFVLLRGKQSGVLYLYDRETYEFMLKNKSLGYGLVLELVVDHDDQEVLRQMQALANDKMEE